MYLLIKDIEERKKERERLKMIQYDGGDNEQMKSEDAYAPDYQNNQLALVPMQDYEGEVIDYTEAALGETIGNYNPELMHPSAMIAAQQQ